MQYDFHYYLYSDEHNLLTIFDQNFFRNIKDIADIY